MRSIRRFFLYRMAPIFALLFLAAFSGAVCRADNTDGREYLIETYDLSVDAMSDVELLDTLQALGNETAEDIISHMTESQKERYLRISEPEPLPKLTGMIPYFIDHDGVIRSDDDVDISLKDVQNGALERLMFLLNYEDGSSGYIYADGPGVTWNADENGALLFSYSDGENEVMWASPQTSSGTE